MAETTPLRNTLSRRYSTTRPLGFRGGSIGPGGNMQPPTAGQVSGINKPAPKVPEQPAISQFSADIPSPAVSGPLGAIGSGVAGSMAAKAGTNAIDRVLNRGASTAINFNDVATPLAGEVFKPGGGMINQQTGAETFPMISVPPVTGTPLPDTTSGFGGVTDANLAMEGYDALSGAADFGGAAFEGANAADLAMEGFDAAGGVASEGIPYLGPALQLAQGNVGGAVGSVIGSLAAGPIGGFIGGMIGGGGDCFITEAVMSAGGQDGGPELNVLRGFRDQVMMATPIGQSMVQQYEQIAPLVVEAVTQRPDALQIFQSIKAQFIDPAVQAVQQGDNDQALRIYAQMIAFVTPFAIEAEVGPGAEGAERVEDGQEGIDDLGTQAAMVANSPEITQAVTGAPDGGMMMQNDQLPAGPSQTSSPPPMMAGGPMSQGMVPNGNMPPPPGAGMGPMPQQQTPMSNTFARKRY